MTEAEVLDAGGERLKTMHEFDGELITTFANSIETSRKALSAIPDIKLRPGDVFLSTPVKSGTHWTYEIIYQLLHGKAETTPFSKMATMIEATPPEVQETIPSPRVMNSHLRFARLPKAVQEGDCKIVLVLRNPKDVFVSMYKHHIGAKFYEYSGKWENYFPLILHGKLEYGSWFDIVRDWERRIDEHPDRILLVYYEDMKQNPAAEISQIALFLGIQTEDRLIQEIAEKTSFENMKKEKEYKGQEAEKLFRPGFNIFRKGSVGDWKNYFTVRQNEEFQEVYDEKMNGSKLQFRFE